jgi:hypothetical protein
MGIMPYIPDEQVQMLKRELEVLKKWKEETEKKLEFLKLIKLEGRGRITLSGGHLIVNSNIDTKTIENGIT